MQTSVTFKNLDSSENLKSYVRNKLNRLDKLLDNLAEANVVLLVEKFRHIAEINIIGDRLTITGKEETGDMYSAIDIVMDKLEKQIKKNKQKIKKRRVGSRTISKGIMDEDINHGYDEVEKQVRVKNIEYKPMDVEEAVMQMSLVKYNFLVFTNARTEKINVLYQRNDGHYGLIQPSN
jgi:putative sigma-54 modulation protein